jgi:hypothetical protein
MKNTFKTLTFLLSFFLLGSSVILAQSSFGDIKGTVADATGAVVSGAAVSVQNQDTNETRTTTTNAEGEFSVSKLNVGTYTISVTSQGFAPSKVTDVKVSVAFTTEQNVTLNIGSTETTVTVTSGDAATQINTTNQQLSTLISNQKLQDLPLLSRDPSSLVLLAPGTVQTDSGLGGFSINGSRERNNNFLVDGVDNNDTDVPGIPGGIATPNIDATEEFRVISGNFTAEYGRNTGGVITVATKRGTNGFHGGTYLYYRSDKFAARNFFDTTGEADPLDRKQFGFSIGGPIVKDKLFFFFNYEGDRSKSGSQEFRAVPTALARTGILQTQQYGTLDIRPGGANNALGNLGLALPFSPTIQSLLTRVFPLPNYPANGARPAPLPGVFEYYTFGFTARDKVDSIATRVDYNLNSSNILSFSANYGKGDYSFGAPTFPTFDDGLRSPQQGGVYALNLLSNISSNIINEFRVGTNRVVAAFNGPGDGGISNSINDAVNAAFTANGVPRSNFGGENANALNLFTPFTSIGNFSTQSRTTGTTTVGDTVTWVKGGHTFKFGGEARFIYSNGQSNFSRQESIDFSFPTTFGVPIVRQNGGAGAVPLTGSGALINDYLSFLTGLVALQTQTQFFDLQGKRVDNDLRRYRTNEYGVFAQDTWRIRQDLTLNLGLRYEYSTVPYEKDGLLSNLVNQDPSLATPAGGFVFETVGKNSDNPDIPLYDKDKNNFGPRVGFAYSPGFTDGLLGKVFGGPSKSSFRGGYGIFYDRVFTNLFSNTSANPPFALSVLEIPFNNGTPTLETTPRLAAAMATNRANNGDELTVVLFPTSKNNILQDKFVTPSSASWNFGFQRQLGENFLFEIDYVGTRGFHLIRDVNAQLTNVRRARAITGDVTRVQTLNLRENYENGSLNTAFGQSSAFLIISTGNSEYNAMQVRVTKTLTNKRFGLGQLQAFYTWSHSIDDAPDSLVTGANDRSLPRDSSGYSGGLYAERGDSSFDARHRFVANFIYQLPFTFKNNIVDKIFGNWTLTGIYQAQTGYPFSVFMNGVDRQGTGLSSRATYANGTGGLPNSTFANDRNYTGPNRSLFASSVPADGNQGNVSRSTFRGPKFSKFDFSILKRFPITERYRFTIRADFFNLFNTVNFSSPVNDVLSSNFGVSLGAGSARIIQFAGRFDF